jgi:DNA-binding MarR family transcriptional regulator
MANSLQSFDQVIDLLTRFFAQQEADALQSAEFSELSMKQIVYLETIAALERPTFSDLARRLEVSKPSVTAIVDKLVQKGYVERVQSAEDKRAYHILLTAKGASLSEIHHQIHQHIARHFSEALTAAELDQLAGLLHKVIRHLAP